MKRARPSLWRRFLRSPLAGFSLGMALVATFFALYYAVPTYLQPTWSETAVVRQGRWVFHLDRDAPLLDRLDALAGEYEAVLDELLTTLSVPAAALPETIHVFLHPDWASVRRAILTRHSPTNTELFLGVIDVLYEASPRAALAELVEAFGWGTSSSRILKVGLDRVLAEPQGQWLARAAAWLGPDFLSLTQLRRLERRGRLPPTLYESFNAPTARSAIDLTLLSRLIRLNVAPDPLQAQLEAEAASFVRFWLDEEGLASLRRLWEAPSWEAGLQALGLDERTLDARWQAVLAARGPTQSRYPAWRGLALSERGRRGEAAAWLERALSLPDLPTELSARVHEVWTRELIEAGRWDEAAELGALPNGRLKAYRRWRTHAGRDVLVHAAPTVPPQLVAARLAEAEAAWRELRATLALAGDLPEGLVLFLYADAAQREALLEDETAPTAPRRGVAHLVLDQEVRPFVARVMVEALRPPTNTPFLLEGLVVALEGPERVRAQARSLLEEDRWVPLSRLSFDGAGRATARLEAGALLAYLLEREGPVPLKRLWPLTSPLGENLSFSSALEGVYGRGLVELEAALRAWLVAGP